MLGVGDIALASKSGRSPYAKLDKACEVPVSEELERESTLI